MPHDLLDSYSKGQQNVHTQFKGALYFTHIVHSIQCAHSIQGNTVTTIILQVWQDIHQKQITSQPSTLTPHTHTHPSPNSLLQLHWTRASSLNPPPASHTCDRFIVQASLWVHHYSNGPFYVMSLAVVYSTRKSSTFALLFKDQLQTKLSSKTTISPWILPASVKGH